MQLIQRWFVTGDILRVLQEIIYNLSSLWKLKMNLMTTMDKTR